MINYMDLSILGFFFKREGSVIPTAFLKALPTALLAVILAYLRDSGGMDLFWEENEGESLTSSQLWGGLVASLSFLVAFRNGKAYSRFWDGTTLLHQMFGEWFDASTCLVAFSTLAKAKKTAEVSNFRHTLIRLMSLCHASALEEISKTDGHEKLNYPVLDLGALDEGTLEYLTKAKFDKNLNFNRVEVVIHMIQTLVVNAQAAGTLQIPPPILSRVFQTLSRGQVNLANCKKITNTLFPFPYAQMISWLLVVFAIMTPTLMSSLFQNSYWGVFFSFLPVFALIALNDTAMQLEMPFGKDSNDLPLEDFQDHMNTALLMLIREETDHVAFVREKSYTSYDDIRENINLYAPKHFLSAEMFSKTMSYPVIPDQGLSPAPMRETGSSLDALKDTADAANQAIKDTIVSANEAAASLISPPALPPAESCAAVSAAQGPLPGASSSALSVTKVYASFPKSDNSSVSDLERNLQLSAAALEQSLQGQLKELGQHFQSLLATTNDLAGNMGKHAEILVKRDELARGEVMTFTRV